MPTLFDTLRLGDLVSSKSHPEGAANPHPGGGKPRTERYDGGILPPARLGAPGLVDTTSVTGMVGGEDAAIRVLERASRTNPSGRLSRDSDYAAVVEFLLSPAAEFVQGQAIHANGGAYVAA